MPLPLSPRFQGLGVVGFDQLAPGLDVDLGSHDYCRFPWLSGVCGGSLSHPLRSVGLMTTAAISITETGSGGGVFSAAVVQASGARVLSLLAEAERLTVEAVGEVGLIDRAGLCVLWGYPDTTRLVAHRSGRTRREARDLVVVARLVARHPGTGAALVAGEISLAQAVGLARAACGFDEAYARYEPQLLAACCDRDADALACLVAQWRDHCDTDKAATDAEHRFNQRGVYIQTRLDGSCKGTF